MTEVFVAAFISRTEEGTHGYTKKSSPKNFCAKNDSNDLEDMLKT